jgi:hypothetical protein
VTGNGVSLYFTGFGIEVCGMATANEHNEGCFGRDLLSVDPHSIAVSPFSSPFAIVPFDLQFMPSNEIFVLDASTLGLLEQHVVTAAGTGGGVLRVEQMDFSANGQWIIADALNPVTGAWGIYAVHRPTGPTQALVPPVSGLQMRNASYALTSDD